MDMSATNLIGMAVFTVLLLALAIWAQSFRKQARDIIGNRNIFLGVSGALVLVCLAALVYRGTTTGFNMGMDFTGGTVIEVGFYDNLPSLTTQKITTAIEEVAPDLKEPQVQLEENVTHRPNLDLGSPSPEASATPAGDATGITVTPAGSPTDLMQASPSASPAASASPEASASPAASPASSGSPQGFRGEAVTVQLSPAPEASASATSSASPAPSASAAPTAATINPSPVAPYKKAIIRLGRKGGEFKALTTSEITEFLNKLQGKLGRLTNPPFSIESNDPVIGKELLNSGVLALLIALGLQLVYITFRFGNQVRYGIAADVALVHDIIIMVGFYVLFNRQIDSPFLAALLTVIGYSVMDSIVIFDRIRENVKLNRKADFEQVVNKSVNETMTRSINTLMTVLLCLFALYFFGEITLRNFAFALLVGITSGGYSSIFIASPILVMWDRMAKSREAEQAQQRRAQMAQPRAGTAAPPEKAVEEEPEEAVEESGSTQRPRPARRRSGARRRSR